MKFLTLLFIGIAGLISPISAQETRPFSPIDAAETTLEEQRWISRPVLLFAVRPEDPQIIRQLEMLEADWPALAARDVEIIVDTNPAGDSDARQTIRPHGFMMVLLAKDGTVARRKPRPWSARELIRAIDKMPLRIEEEKERRILNPRTVQ